MPAIQLEYVGHAALTDRLLDVDLSWTWEPVALDAMGYPAIDGNGGLWIRLTVNGVTRLGYGDAQGKVGGDAMKERIGDALRNAAMRFGAALDLWHKGVLHIEEEGDDAKSKKPPVKPELPPCPDTKIVRWMANVKEGKGVAGELLAFAKGRYTLSAEQEARISEFVKAQQNPPIDAGFVEFVEEYEKATGDK